MRSIRVMAFIAVITLFMGVAVVGDALAGEKVKARGVAYMTNWQSAKVPDQEGHVMGFWEGKGVHTVLAGPRFVDGAAYNEVGVVDLNTKTGERKGMHGYNEVICQDGDRIYNRWEFTHVSEGMLHGTWEYYLGTGKYEGIKGKGTYASHVMGDRWYADWEGEVELPKK
jgi:hypothetical protein